MRGFSWNIEHLAFKNKSTKNKVANNVVIVTLTRFAKGFYKMDFVQLLHE